MTTVRENTHMSQSEDDLSTRLDKLGSVSHGWMPEVVWEVYDQDTAYEMHGVQRICRRSGQDKV